MTSNARLHNCQKSAIAVATETTNPYGFFTHPHRNPSDRTRGRTTGRRGYPRTSRIPSETSPGRRRPGRDVKWRTFASRTGRRGDEGAGNRRGCAGTVCRQGCELMKGGRDRNPHRALRQRPFLQQLRAAASP